MRLASMFTCAACVVALALTLHPAASPAATGLAAGKSCHVVRTCNFSKKAEVRGCLSSYSCRQCNLVRQRGSTASGRRFEWRTVCNWGAGS